LETSWRRGPDHPNLSRKTSGVTGIEPVPTSAPGVVESREVAGKQKTQDDSKLPDVSAQPPSSGASCGACDPLELALASALSQAAAAGRFDVVGQLARELEAVSRSVTPRNPHRSTFGGHLLLADAPVRELPP
jgi:hypothetical protein